LISLGGTSTVFTCITIGIILSISRSVFNPEAFANPDDQKAELELTEEEEQSRALAL
jgi:hypothetical protein